MTRRTLLASAAFAVTSKKSWGFASNPRRITVHPNVEIGTIRPELHGQFAEHLGNCTYSGLWVGRDSPVPNINGYRKQAVEYLRELGIPVLRWPGGCFADDYHWRDGIGPAAQRPRRVNIWWGQYTEDNSFGTHEFIGLCRLIGAEPYLAGNLGSGTPAELRQWMEYCNFPGGSTLSDERAANGSKQPFNVKYWGVGNENWGCGGNMTPQEYAAHYRRFATFLLPRGGIGDTKAFLIACGPNGNNPAWSRGFLETMSQHLNQVHGFAMHFYSGGKSPATKFTVETMNDQLGSFARLEEGIVQQHALLRSFDPAKRIGLLVDEWGVWDRIQREDEKRYGALFQQITMRSAIAAALGLNVFHRHADKLIMCNIAQTVNVLHAILLTDADKTIRTSTYYAFELEKPHRGKAALRIDNEEKDAIGLSVSASRGRDEAVVTLVNPKHDQALRVECVLPGATLSGARARILYHSDFNACNTFENPDIIVPKDHPVEIGRGALIADLPPLSILTATVRLA